MWYNPRVTKQQLYLFGCLYLVILAVVAVLTRATPRRIAGALVGAAVAGVALLGIVAIGESAGWWHMAMTWEPYFLTLMCIATIPCGFPSFGSGFCGRWQRQDEFTWIVQPVRTRDSYLLSIAGKIITVIAFVLLFGVVLSCQLPNLDGIVERKITGS